MFFSVHEKVARHFSSLLLLYGVISLSDFGSCVEKKCFETTSTEFFSVGVGEMGC